MMYNHSIDSTEFDDGRCAVLCCLSASALPQPFGPNSLDD